jgi:UPF0042 nucleotide-binding protein
MSAAGVPVVFVTGLSGAGKLSALRALEDLGFEAVDNPPLSLVEDLVARSDRRLAVGVDARTRGFDADAVLDVLTRLRRLPGLRPELVFLTASDEVLLRRFTETRRRHPLAPQGRVSDGIAEERALTARLREEADLLIDSSDLPLAELRRLMEQRYADGAGSAGLVLFLVSFAFSAGLPREADLVFDARFLRNPHYDPILRPRTGLDADVGAYVAADPDYAAFLSSLLGLIGLVLPRFVQEGKKYATIAVGCTGGRHRSVHLIEALSGRLRENGWNVLTMHRELARAGIGGGGMDSGGESGQEAAPDQPRTRESGPGSDPAGRRSLGPRAEEA